MTSFALESLEPRMLMSDFTVTNTADSGPGSLRQAILDSNASVGIKETILFNIPISDPGYNPSTDSFTIKPAGTVEPSRSFTAPRSMAATGVWSRTIAPRASPG